MYTREILVIFLLVKGILSQCGNGYSGGQEFQINTAIIGDQLYPNVAAAPNGQFVVVWSDLQGGFFGNVNKAKGQLFDNNGVKIGGEFVVSDTSDSKELALTATTSGNFAVAWRNNATDSIFMSTYSVGGNGVSVVSSSLSLITGYSVFSNANSLSYRSGTGIVLAWGELGQGATSNDVYAQTFTLAGTSVDTKISLPSVVTQIQVFPATTAVAGGYAAVWQSDTGAQSFVYHLYGGIFVGRSPRHFTVDSDPLYLQRNPTITTLANGNFVIVWDSTPVGPSDIAITSYGRIYDINGTALGDKFQISPRAVFLGSPHVASLGTPSGPNQPAFVVVYQDAAGTGSTYGQVFDENGGRVGNEFQIALPETSVPRVATLTDSSFVVTYSRRGGNPDGNGDAVYGRIFYKNSTQICTAGLCDNGYSQGNQFQVNTVTQGDQLYPNVVALPGNGFVTAFADLPQGFFGATNNAKFQRFDGSANKLGGEVTVSSTSDSKILPIAAFSTGVFAIAWRNNATDSILTSVYSSAGVSSASGTVASAVQVGVDAGSLAALTSNFILVWTQLGQGGTSNDVWSTVFTPATTVSSNQILPQVNSQIQVYPAVASLPSGGFVAVWQSDQNNTAFFYNLYGVVNNGNTNFYFKVNDDPNADQESASVAVLPNGNFVVVWDSRPKELAPVRVFGRLFNSTTGSALGDRFQIGSPSQSYSTPHVAVFNPVTFKGAAFVVVYQTAFGTTSTYGQLFTVNGIELGSEFLIFADSTSVPRVAVLNNNNFVVVYSNRQAGIDGNGAGSYGQIFTNNSTRTCVVPYPVTPATSQATNQATTQATNQATSNMITATNPMTTSPSFNSTSTHTDSSSNIVSISMGLIALICFFFF